MNSDEIKNVQKLIMNYKKQIQSLLDTKATIHIDSEDYSLLEKKQTQLLEDLQKILYDFNKSTSATNEDNNIELPLNANSIEEEYYKYDCAELPGYIFFHDSIIKSYGLCPFINIPENGLSDNLEDSLVK
jgi:aspartate carbamoyltransferase regulatory subunit